MRQFLGEFPGPFAQRFIRVVGLPKFVFERSAFLPLGGGGSPWVGFERRPSAHSFCAKPALRQTRRALALLEPE